MARSNIKGITIEIGGDTTNLAKALADVEKQSRDLAGELREVDKLLKLDPTNTTLVAQKQDLLAKSVTNTKGKLETLKEAEKQAQVQFAKGDISEKQYRDLQKEVQKTEIELKSLEKQAIQVNAVLTKDQAVGNLKNIAKAAGAVGLAVGGALVASAVKAGQNADDINTMAKQTGLATDTIQKFQFASDRIDVSMDTLTGSMSKLTKNMSAARDGSEGMTMSLEDQEKVALKVERAEKTYSDAVKKHGEDSLEAREAQMKLNEAQEETPAALKGAAEAFDTLGVSVVDSNGELRDNEDVFNDTITKLGEMTNETERDALAMKIFGKSAQDLNPLILGGADALKIMGDEAEAAGLILSQDALDSANAFADSMDEIKAVSSGIFAKVGTEVAEQLLPMLNGLLDLMTTLPTWISENSTMLTILAVVFGTITALVIAFNIQQALMASGLTLFGGIAAGATIVTTALGAAFAFLTSPIGLVILAIGAAIAIGVLLYKNWDTVKIKVGELWTKIKDVFGKVESAITNPFTTAKKIVGGIVDGIKGLFDFEWKMPKIKLPHFSVSWSKAGFWGSVGDFLGLPGKPSIGVSWYAKGGIFDQPTIFNTPYGLKGVGEAGPEVVAPLSDLKEMLGLNGSNQGINITIENFTNNTHEDVDTLINEIAYRTQRKLAGGGYSGV